MSSPRPDAPVVLAAVQMTSTGDRQSNLATATRLIDDAAQAGATFIGLPENFAFLGADEERLAFAESTEGPTVSRLREQARRLGVTVLAGSIAERLAGDARHTANTSVLIGPDGDIVATYRKIHLFDVAIPDGARYAESESVLPGREPVLATTAFARVGLTICYDLRFPELFRHLSAAGAEILCVPAAFTELTGKAHWEVLLRARAIENLAYVVAPAQVGQNTATRRTFGQAMVIDPWGVVLGRCESGEGFCLGTFSPARLREVRTQLPALGHRRL